VPLIVSCLENIPDDRPAAEEVCDQLETLVVNSKCISTLPEHTLQKHLLLNKLQNEVTEKAAEIGNLQRQISHLQSRVSNTSASKVRNVWNVHCIAVLVISKTNIRSVYTSHYI